MEYPRQMFARLAAEGRFNTPPDLLDGLGILVDTLFFASLMVEEGEPVRLAIVHHEEGAAGLATVTDESPGPDEDEPELAWDVAAIPEQPFDAPTLAKLSRGVAYGRQLIVVRGDKDQYRIDGIARRRPRTDGGSVVRFAAPRPGVIVFERNLRQLLRYEAGQQGRASFDVVGHSGPVRDAIAVINGETRTRPSGFPGGHTFYSFWERAVHQLVQRTRSTESGAILAMLPGEPAADLLGAVRYGRRDSQVLTKRVEVDRARSMDRLNTMLHSHDEELSRERVREREAAEHAAEVAREELDAAIEDVAQLSAIDGAVLMGPKLTVYGAGCVLPSFELDPAKVRRALDLTGERTEPYPNRHGARHRAGFCFAYSNPGAVAFVVSEDGPISCAHRVGEHVLVWSVEVLET